MSLWKATAKPTPTLSWTMREYPKAYYFIISALKRNWLNTTWLSGTTSPMIKPGKPGNIQAALNRCGSHPTWIVPITVPPLLILTMMEKTSWWLPKAVILTPPGKKWLYGNGTAGAFPAFFRELSGQTRGQGLSNRQIPARRIWMTSPVFRILLDGACPLPRWHVNALK